MRKSLFLVFVLCLTTLLGLSAAFAEPYLTNGKEVAYIGEENHLFLQDAQGGTKTLRADIVDLIGMNATQLYVLTAEGQLYNITMDGSAATTIQASHPAETELAALATVQPYALTGGVLTVTQPGALSMQVAANVSLIARNRTHLYWVEQNNVSTLLKRISLADGSIAAETVTTLAQPAMSLVATDEAVTVTNADHSLTVVDLNNNYSVRGFAASGDKTQTALVMGNQLYRFSLEQARTYRLEGMEAAGLTQLQSRSIPAAPAVATPTQAPVVTATPRPTAKPTAKPTATKKPNNSDDEDDGAIKFGARGRYVRKIQQRLMDLGYPITSVDGVYGEDTLTAIKCFQHAIGYRERSTFIRSAQNKLFGKNAPYFDMTEPLKLKDRGIMVRIMQIALQDAGFDIGMKNPDGVYGPKTQAAVRAYQASINLPQTGDADRITLGNLYHLILPTPTPTELPPAPPIDFPTDIPTQIPTTAPTTAPTAVPTQNPTDAPTTVPTDVPTNEPTTAPTDEPTADPTTEPTQTPSGATQTDLHP